MNKKSPYIKYKEVILNPKFTKDFNDTVKYELSVTMRLIDNVPNPNCNWNKNVLIEKLKRNGVKKSIDLYGINDAPSFKDYLSKHNVFICK